MSVSEEPETNQPDGWSTNSNDCFYISLMHDSEKEHARFNPEFTYPIFGESEAIFGYKGLLIELTFAAHNMTPRLHISWDEQYPGSEEVQATNIASALADFLPSEAFNDTRLSYSDASTYVPPGDVARSYTRDGKKYEVRVASLNDSRAKKLLQSMQVLVPFFIEGGTMLQLEQDWTTKRWKLFTLWQVDSTSGAAHYALVGYGTSYRVFAMPKESRTNERADSLEPDFMSGSDLGSPLELPSRERLSQFLILPTFQNAGHGQELYRAMYKALSTPSNVREFTVEDPNEDFDDLRDFCDLTYLRNRSPEFAALKIETDIPAASFGSSKTVPIDLIVPKAIRDKIRTDFKIETRQFDRLVEMQTLSKIPAHSRSKARITRREKTSNEKDKQYYLWRLYVKQRLLIFNEEALRELERDERVEKLEATVDTNLEHFSKLIDKVLAREASGLDLDGEGGSIVNGRAGKKRKVLDDDDDDDDNMDIVSNSSKRAKG